MDNRTCEKMFFYGTLTFDSLSLSLFSYSPSHPTSSSIPSLCSPKNIDFDSNSANQLNDIAICITENAAVTTPALLPTSVEVPTFEEEGHPLFVRTFVCNFVYYSVRDFVCNCLCVSVTLYIISFSVVFFKFICMYVSFVLSS